MDIGWCERCQMLMALLSLAIAGFFLLASGGALEGYANPYDVLF